MGLIKAALSSTFGVLSDQFKEYFYCESLSADVLVVKGQKRGGTGNDNIISNGSIINVADGQCMIIVESGKVVDIWRSTPSSLWSSSSWAPACPPTWFGN